MNMTIITLTTDFGLRDGNVGVMKGVIWGLAPEVRIADLSHTIGPQDVREAAWVLKRAVPYFQDGTIHMVVVDPGVGTARRPMAARLGTQYFVGPDNGVFTRVLARAEREGLPVDLVHLDRPRFWREHVSNVFHGRDIFAPVAAHLARGVPLAELGAPLADPVRLALPEPARTPEGLRGEIAHVDHFGNLATNITRADLAGRDRVRVRVAGVTLSELVYAFGDRPPGTLVALYSSTDDLMVSVVNGSAAGRLSARAGDLVEALFD
jgi:hypothetical protein